MVGVVSKPAEMTDGTRLIVCAKCYCTSPYLSVKSRRGRAQIEIRCQLEVQAELQLIQLAPAQAQLYKSSHLHSLYVSCLVFWSRNLDLEEYHLVLDLYLRDASTYAGDRTLHSSLGSSCLVGAARPGWFAVVRYQSLGGDGRCGAPGKHLAPC